MNDQALHRLLKQHCGSLLDMQQKTKIKYSEVGDCDFEELGWDVVSNEPPPAEIFDIMEYFNRPASPDFVAANLSRLRITLIRRAESESDMELLIDTLYGLIKGYPADLIALAANRWLREERFFPLPKEFCDFIEARVAFRRAVLDGLKAGPKALPPPPPPMAEADWRDLPRLRWDAACWAAYVAEARGMVKLAEENPGSLDLEGWLAEVNKREAEWSAAIGGSAAQTEAPATPVAEEG